MLIFFKAPFLVIHFSYYTLLIFLAMLSVTLLSRLMIIVLYSKYEQAYDLWQQLEFASDLEYDLRVRKCLFDFNTEKTQLILFDRSKNSSAIDVKMDGYVAVFRKFFS